MRNNEEEEKFEAKREEEEQKRMQQYEKHQRKQSQRLQEYYRNLPEKQLRMFLSVERHKCSLCRAHQNAEFFGHAKSCAYYTNGGHDIEPGLQLLKKEYSKGKIIRLDEQTHNRLVEFAKPDEDPVELINRLLDIALSESASVQASPSQTRV
jgi:hypothetical protein